LLTLAWLDALQFSFHLVRLSETSKP
jgi:hypothetical protein